MKILFVSDQFIKSPSNSFTLTLDELILFTTSSSVYVRALTLINKHAIMLNINIFTFLIPITSLRLKYIIKLTRKQ